MSELTLHSVWELWIRLQLILLRGEVNMLMSQSNVTERGGIQHCTLTPHCRIVTGFIGGILRGVRDAKSLRVLFLHRRSPSWTTLVLYSRVVFIFNEPIRYIFVVSSGLNCKKCFAISASWSKVDLRPVYGSYRSFKYWIRADMFSLSPLWA